MNITEHTYLPTIRVSARGHSDTPDVIMTLVSYFCGLPGLARKARKQYSDVIMTELILRSPRSCTKGAFTRTLQLQGFPIKVTICRNKVTPLFDFGASMPPGKKTKNTLACVFTVANVLGTWQTQGRKLSTATTATAVDALQLAEVPLKIDPYSRPKWPVPSHPPGRGAPLGSSEKLSS